MLKLHQTWWFLRRIRWLPTVPAARDTGDHDGGSRLIPEIISRRRARNLDAVAIGGARCCRVRGACRARRRALHALAAHGDGDGLPTDEGRGLGPYPVADHVSHTHAGGRGDGQLGRQSGWLGCARVTSGPFSRREPVFVYER